ncbi:MAG: S8 family serine peptidase [Lewinellaceae bacterium]|nr:S8 family serine peptidase [Lewinellaceae bacterium]
MFRPLFALLLFLGALSFLRGQTACPKCSPTLLVESRSPAPERFTVVTSDLIAFERRLAEMALEIAVLHTYTPAGIVVLYCPRTILLEKILPLPEVLFADLGQATANEERAVPGHNLFVNNIRYVHTRQPELNGSGVTISIKEFRFDSTDVDLKNRVLPTGKSAPILSGHAVLMATLAAGAGNSDPEARGVARGSRLVSSSFVGLLPDDDADYAGFDISVQNHSYGLGIENYYGAGALAYDQSTQQHPDLLHVFSVGNQGAETAPTGTYAGTEGFANLTGNFKMAKNVLTVGSVDSFANVTPFSSRGPAYDGRVKPDLVAFGQNGSSEASALVSGAAAVVRQAFLEKYGFRPKSDLVRAILIGTCDEVGPPGPDFSSGYGNLNLKKAVELVQSQYMAVGELAAGETTVFEIVLPPNVRQFKTTLCWNDVPALPNATQSIVNDLDLSVTAPDGSVWQPWTLNVYPSRDSLLLPAYRGRDSINTTEQVVIEQPAAGTCIVRVHGKVVPGGSQAFALAFAWDTLQHFEWTCPVRNDPAGAGKEAVLRWETTRTTETGSIEWKPAGSDQWRSLMTNIPLGVGYWKWLLPDTTAAAQVRMRTGGSDFVSDTFLIAPNLRVRVGFNCPDSLLLRWPAVASAVSYQVWGLGDRYLEPLLVTSDTVLVLQKSAYAQERFAVSARFNGTFAEGPTAGTPDIDQQGAGCYINNLLALLDAEQVHLTLDLGSIYGVRKIFLEKPKNGVWVVLLEESLLALQILSVDSALVPGTNTYRARLEMENGGAITSEPVLVYYPGEAGYLVLPNPLLPGQMLTVLARFSAETPRFFLYDMMGRYVLEKPLEGGRTEIVLPDLPPGCYVWMVASGSSERLARGKLMVRR